MGAGTARLLGAPNSGASFDLRLGPHVAMSPCFLFLLIGLAVAFKKCNSDAKGTTTRRGLVLWNVSYRK